MAFEEDPKFETFIASVNVSALSYTSTDGSTINYASGGIGYGCAVKHDVATGISGDVILAGGYIVLHRSEEHTSELQSRQYLVCRLLLEKKKKKHEQQRCRLLSLP